MTRFSSIIASLALLLAAVPAGAQDETTGTPAEQKVVTFDQTHGLWTEVLAAHTRNGLFDYAALKKERARLDKYVGRLEKVDPQEFAGWKREERYAFWINAYNAYTIRRVVDNYPVKSIKDIGGIKQSVWDQEFIPLAKLAPDGKERKLLSLNDVEHEILRPTYKDARVHAAVNCASLGCPPLRKEAFTGKDLDKQLDEAVRTWLADGTRNHFDEKTGLLELSMIFKWFGEDFERDAKTVVEWVAKYAPEEQKAWLENEEKVTVRYLTYDWQLNRTPPAEELVGE